MSMPLEGVRVIELTRGWAGPGAAMYLADQGAEVIKVESLAGDEARHFFTAAPIQGEDRGFLVVNRNKRGMAVDIGKEAGRQIIYKLVERSDVLIENFRPGVAHRLKLDYETLQAINPMLIHASLYAFGPKGPYAHLPAYDLVAQALAGIMGERHHPDGTPMSAGVWVADCSTPMTLAYGIAVALLVRARTGKGQRVETALVNQALAMQSVELVRSQGEQRRPPQRYTVQATYSPYQCADGQYLIAVIVTDDQWQRICRVLGLEHLAQDPEFNTPLKRAQQGEVLYPILASVYLTRTREEWLEALREADMPCAPVLRREEVFSHPQFLENEMIVEVEHPQAGKVQMMGVPLRLPGTPTRIRRPAPLLGQHTQEILQELGYSTEQTRQLQGEGIVPR